MDFSTVVNRKVRQMKERWIINCKLAKIVTEYSNGICSDYFKFDMRKEGAEANTKDERAWG